MSRQYFRDLYENLGNWIGIGSIQLRLIVLAPEVNQFVDKDDINLALQQHENLKWGLVNWWLKFRNVLYLLLGGNLASAHQANKKCVLYIETNSSRTLTLVSLSQKDTFGLNERYVLFNDYKWFS